MADAANVFSLGTFERGDREFVGVAIDEIVYPVTGPSPNSNQLQSVMLDIFEEWETWWPRLTAFADQIFAGQQGCGQKLADLKSLAPIRPRQILCSGANYRKHVVEIMVDHDAASDVSLSLEERRAQAERIMDHRAEAGQPFAFMKPYTAVLAPFDDLVIPADSSQLDWELELGVVIGKAARRVTREQAMSHVAAYVVTNDISARDHIVRADFPSLGMDWIACKGGPGFLPIGPTIIPAAFVPNPQNLRITLTLNGEVMQDGSTSDMIFPIARLIEYLSIYMQLLPGDVICTGSPAGNGTHHGRFLQPGDVLEGTIELLGTQRNRCVAERVGDGAPLHRPFTPLQMARERKLLERPSPLNASRATA